MLNNWLNLISILFVICQGTFNLCSFYLSLAKAYGFSKLRWPNTLWKWTKWPTIVGIYSQPVISVLLNGKLGWVDLFAFVMGIFAWHINKDLGDDDDFKRKFKKVKEKIVEQAGKLVVVPEPA